MTRSYSVGLYRTTQKYNSDDFSQGDLGRMFFFLIFVNFGGRFCGSLNLYL